eukprot:3937402-Rhodomonas_salina.2
MPAASASGNEDVQAAVTRQLLVRTSNHREGVLKAHDYRDGPGREKHREYVTPLWTCLDTLQKGGGSVGPWQGTRGFVPYQVRQRRHPQQGSTC